MHILDVPSTQHDLRYSLSMTGVTMLKEGRYKTRHGGSNIISQRPSSTLPIPIPKTDLKSKRPRKRKKSITTPQIDYHKPTTEKKERLYTIKKKLVRAKIIGFVNQMKGEKLLYFWTVSFPKGTTDNAAWLLLNKWLTRLRKEKMLHEYL